MRNSVQDYLVGCSEVAKTKVSDKQEKQYQALKKDLELAVKECKAKTIQADKHIYAEKLGYAIEILHSMDKIKPLSTSNRLGLKFMIESKAMIDKGTTRHLLSAVNPMRLRKYHRKARKIKQDDADND